MHLRLFHRERQLEDALRRRVSVHRQRLFHLFGFRRDPQPAQNAEGQGADGKGMEAPAVQNDTQHHHHPDPQPDPRLYHVTGLTGKKKHQKSTPKRAFSFLW